MLTTICLEGFTRPKYSKLMLSDPKVPIEMTVEQKENETGGDENEVIIKAEPPDTGYNVAMVTETTAKATLETENNTGSDQEENQQVLDAESGNFRLNKQSSKTTATSTQEHAVKGGDAAEKEKGDSLSPINPSTLNSNPVKLSPINTTPIKEASSKNKKDGSEEKTLKSRAQLDSLQRMVKVEVPVSVPEPVTKILKVGRKSGKKTPKAKSISATASYSDAPTQADVYIEGSDGIESRPLIVNVVGSQAASSETAEVREVSMGEQADLSGIDMDNTFWETIQNLDGTTREAEKGAQMLSLGLKRKGQDLEGNEAETSERSGGRRLRKRKKVNYTLLDGEGSREMMAPIQLKDVEHREVVKKQDYRSEYIVEQQELTTSKKQYFPPAASVPEGCNSRYANGIIAKTCVLTKSISDKQGNTWVETRTYPQRQTIYSGFASKRFQGQSGNTGKQEFVICHPKQPVVKGPFKWKSKTNRDIINRTRADLN